jgi:hypothetical protein
MNAFFGSQPPSSKPEAQASGPVAPASSRVGRRFANGVFVSAPFLPLAEASRSASLSESFRSHAGMGRDDVLLGLLMAVALVAGLWAATRLLGMRRRRRGYHNPWKLFRALAKAHRLRWSDRRLLARVARQQNIRDPARLFLEVQLWDEQALGPAFALEIVRLRTLRMQIFEASSQTKSIETGARRTSARVRKTALLRNDDLPPRDGGSKSDTAAAHGNAPSQTDEGKTPMRGAANASPLFSSPPAPTLDLPPWTDGQNVDV